MSAGRVGSITTTSKGHSLATVSSPKSLLEKLAAAPATAHLALVSVYKKAMKRKLSLIVRFVLPWLTRTQDHYKIGWWFAVHSLDPWEDLHQDRLPK